MKKSIKAIKSLKAFKVRFSSAIAASKTVSFDDIKDTDIDPVSFQDNMDRPAWENLFHDIPQDQLEVLVCLLLGLKPKEIVNVLGYPNMQKFYKMNTRLKNSYKNKKDKFN